MSFKSVLGSPSASVLAGTATAGLVFGVYQANIGTTAQAAATDANHPLLETSRKKAGYTALAIVSAMVLLTKDLNVGIIGGGAIIFMELSARHAIMASPQTGRMVNPNPAAAYAPAENVIPMYAQGEAG